MHIAVSFELTVFAGYAGKQIRGLVFQQKIEILRFFQTILLKTNAFLFKKTISKILDKTHGGSVYKWRANKIYRYMYGLAKNLEVAKKELEDSDWSPAVALDVERDVSGSTYSTSF